MLKQLSLLSLIFFIFFGSVEAFFWSQQSNDGELVRVVIVHRHGDRAPIMSMPWDQKRSIWFNGYGQLTNVFNYFLFIMILFNFINLNIL